MESLRERGADERAPLKNMLYIRNPKSYKFAWTIAAIIAGELKQEQVHPGAWKLADEIRQEALSDRSLLKGIARGEISKYIDILSEPCEEAGYKPGIREARIIKELQALLRMSA